MSRNFSYYSLIVSAVLFGLLVFKNFFGDWTAGSSQRIVFFFCMVSAVFAAGMETGKRLNNKS